MPRKLLVRSNHFPYHVTARCNNREPFPCTLREVWKTLTNLSLEAHMLYGARTHGLVLMSNHFHLLMTTPREDIGVVMKRFLESGTKTLNLISGRSGRIFGSRYHWSLVNSARYFRQVLKYVYRNPVRAGVCERVEDYEFSTLQGLLGRSRLEMPLYFPFNEVGFVGLPEEPIDQIDWFNQPFRKEVEVAIKSGLKQTEFGPMRQGWNRTIAELLEPEL